MQGPFLRLTYLVASLECSELCDPQQKVVQMEAQALRSVLKNGSSPSALKETPLWQS